MSKARYLRGVVITRKGVTEPQEMVPDRPERSPHRQSPGRNLFAEKGKTSSPAEAQGGRDPGARSTTISALGLLSGDEESGRCPFVERPFRNPHAPAVTACCPWGKILPYAPFSVGKTPGRRRAPVIKEPVQHPRPLIASSRQFPCLLADDLLDQLLHSPSFRCFRVQEADQDEGNALFPAVQRGGHRNGRFR